MKWFTCCRGSHGSSTCWNGTQNRDSVLDKPYVYWPQLCAKYQREKLNPFVFGCTQAAIFATVFCIKVYAKHKVFFVHTHTHTHTAKAKAKKVRAGYQTIQTILSLNGSQQQQGKSVPFIFRDSLHPCLVHLVVWVWDQKQKYHQFVVQDYLFRQTILSCFKVRWRILLITSTVVVSEIRRNSLYLYLFIILLFHFKIMF